MEMNDPKYDTTKDNDEPAAKGGVGAAVGAAAGGVAGGAAAGALAGGITGPIGAVLGAAVGAVAGAMARGAMTVDPVVEDSYWRDNYASRPYATGARYEDLQPAYRFGMDSYAKYPDRSFDDVEPELERNWHGARGSSSLEWERAKHATRDAWHRVGNSAERAVPGDSDRDGR
jgi:hypothetical protein